MKRTLYGRLCQWKDDPYRKPLILGGARQVGKTWLLKEFGKNEYKKVAYISCDADSLTKKVFSEDYRTDRILRELSAMAGVDITPGDTLVIIDEIQECPGALTSLKYFCEDAPQIHICAAGSLLGIALQHGTSFPVGKVNLLTLHPMTFSEFVSAAEGEQTADILMKEPLPQVCDLSVRWIQLLRQYYFTGGMPAVVLAHVSGTGVSEVRQMQDEILAAYERDVAKHTDEKTAVRIRQIWRSMVQQLAKDNKKFVYGHIRAGARAKEYEIGLGWLEDAGLIHRIPRVRKAGMPLKFYEDISAFKLFYLDCGLMGALAETPPAQILVGNSIFEEYKGAFTEQYVVQQLMTLEGSSLYYFSADDSRQEVDFMTQAGDRICAIEVKAEENLQAKSLRLFKERHPDCIAVRLAMSDYREQDWMTNLPLYLAERVYEIVGEIE